MAKTTETLIVERIKKEMKKQMNYKGFSDGTFVIEETTETYGRVYTLEYMANEWLEAVFSFDDIPKKEWMTEEELKNIETRVHKWVNKIETHKNDWLELAAK